jgi:hypothetical protein
LRRAIETGTFRGLTARALAGVFGEVVTIELSPDFHRSAAEALSDLPTVRVLQGHSVERLTEVSDASVPTLYFLDGHWSGGDTSGAEDECPVLEELAAIGHGHPDDAIVIDDARLFTSSPPPPHRAERWPSLLDVIDAIRAIRPDHLITVLNDQVIAVPQRAKPAIDGYGQRIQRVAPLVARARSVATMVRERLGQAS